ncbi:MAG: SUMF1/EgtB/PvdO family nonheme iron enzyme [Opitutaceae bacterium]|nr:SUMF1/EgtB/PvdO family nonheme iron enzyme [Opitutaceae bacterium]
MTKTTTFLVIASIACFGCVVSTDPVSGPKGEPGPRGNDGLQGPPGKDGAPGQPDTAALTALQKQVESLQQRLDALEAAQSNPKCPSGYDAAPVPPAPFLAEAQLCSHGEDEVVRVGSGAGAFWIDRYEASVWTTPDGPSSGTSKFAVNDDTDPAIFPKNGQYVVPHFALSIANTAPARFVTWFQAAAACSVSGKRLPRAEEWLLATRGTSDPGSNDGTMNSKCNTMSASGPRVTAAGLGPAALVSCVSAWGAEDMIGNLWEWTSEWYAGLNTSAADFGKQQQWANAAGGNSDYVGNVSSYIQTGSGTGVGLPATAIRGGDYTDGAGAGALTMHLSYAPTFAGGGTGFRCVVAR